MTAKKGMRGIPFEGKTLRFTVPNVMEFEQDGYEKLLDLKRIQMGAAINSDALMAGYLTNLSILKLALFYGLKEEQPDITLDDIPALIDSYVSSGKSLVDLRRKITEAYALFADPSSVASLLESWRALDEKAKVDDAFQKVAMNQEMNAKQDLMKTLKKNLTDGNRPADLPTSSLASGQT